MRIITTNKRFSTSSTHHCSTQHNNTFKILHNRYSSNTSHIGCTCSLCINLTIHCIVFLPGHCAVLILQQLCRAAWIILMGHQERKYPWDEELHNFEILICKFCLDSDKMNMCLQQILMSLLLSAYRYHENG